MTAASANLAALRYVAETTLGTTPSNPSLTPIRYTGESLNFNITNTTSNEIRSDRSQSDLIQTGAEVSGDINYEFSFDSYDTLIQAALAGTWAGVGSPAAARVLKNGTTRRSFTIQKHLTDIGQFFNYTGCVINTMSLQMRVGEIITGTFGVLGTSATRDAAQISGASVGSTTTTSPLNAVVDVGSIQIDSVPYTGCVSELSLSINNNLRPVDCIGTLGHTDLLYGTTEITGSMNIYFNEGSLYDKFLNATDFSIYLPIANNSDTFEILIPRAKFETGEVVAGGQNSEVMFNATWRALYDSVQGAMIRLTYTNN